jgi:hypothetical protein
VRSLLLILAITLPAATFAGEGIKVGEEFALLRDGPNGEGVQSAPAAAFGENAYLVVWQEGWHGEGGRARVYAARVSPDGKVLDPKGIEVAPFKGKDCVQERPRLAFGGGVFLVVWQDFNGKDCDVLAVRVSPEGKVLDAAPIKVAVGPRNQALPDVASDGKGFLVAWEGWTGADAAPHGFAAAVSAEGKVGPAVETGASAKPMLAWGGTGYLACYSLRNKFSMSVDCVMLSPEGKPAASRPRVFNNDCREAAYSVSAVPGKGWLVVGHRSKPDPWGWSGAGAMRCAFVKSDGSTENRDSSGKAGDPTRFPNWLDYGWKSPTWPWGQSASAWDGQNSVVVWPRYHLVGKAGISNCDIIAGRVDGWKPQDPDGVLVAASPVDEKSPTLASDGAGKLLCIYEKHDADGKVRVVGRILRTK